MPVFGGSRVGLARLFTIVMAVSLVVIACSSGVTQTPATDTPLEPQPATSTERPGPVEEATASPGNATTPPEPTWPSPDGGPEVSLGIQAPASPGPTPETPGTAPSPTATSIPAAGAGPIAHPSPSAISRFLDVEPSKGLPDIDVNRYRQLLGRDVIRPIYDPVFLPASEAETSPNELVMGVVINGEAKAYPITPLRSREIVNDELGGVPILVTW
jgi:hypothetical protein